MTIAEDKVVVMHYSLRANDQLLDSSFDGQPLSFIFGRGFLIPGLEKELQGKQTGDKFEVDVAAADAYGERHDGLVQQVPKSMFGDIEVQVGMQFRATTDGGDQSVVVIDVEEENVVVDGNHPLAGMDLSFDVEVMEVRDASEEELEHGHVHGAGGGCCGGGGCGEGEHKHEHGEGGCCGGKGEGHGGCGCSH